MTLRIDNISKTLQLSTGPKTVLNNISTAVAAGTVTALIGPSGGGKTSLIRLLNRLDDPTSGQILLDDQDIAAIDPLVLRRKVALLPQKPVMFAGSVRDNLLAPLRLHGLPIQTDTQLGDILTRCQIEPGLITQAAQTLSIGQQQRVALARALLLEPSLLLLDEPTGALDRRTADRIAQMLTESGLTILMITHDLRLCDRIATHVLFLEDGALVESGATAQLLHQPRTKQLQSFLAEPDKVGATDE